VRQSGELLHSANIHASQNQPRNTRVPQWVETGNFAFKDGARCAGDDHARRHVEGSPSRKSKMAWVVVAAFAQALRSCVEANVHY
jgi:hypothetical protein